MAGISRAAPEPPWYDPRMSSTARKAPLLLALAAAALLALSCAGAGRRSSTVAGAAREMAEAPRAEPAEAPAPSTGAEEKGATADTSAEAPAAAEEATPGRKLATQAVRLRPPELLARSGTPELLPLPVVAQDVTVVIVGHRARVVMDLVFANPGESAVAGTLMISLPDRASPCALGTYQGGGLSDPAAVIAAAPDDALARALLPPAPAEPDALLAATPSLPAGWKTEDRAVDWGALRAAVSVEPVQGRQVYETVTRARVDPALAEWTGTGSYSARIYPIPAKGLKRVVFAYDLTLVPSGGRILFPLPLPDGRAPARRLTVYDLSGATADGTLTANGKALDSARGPGGSRSWQLAPDASTGVLYVGTPRSPSVLSTAGADPAVPGTLVSLLLTPELPKQSMVTSTGKALFLLDTSASGRDGMSALSAQMLRALLEGDDSMTQFAIVCFDVRATLLTPGFVANTDEARKHYLGLVDQIWLEGATAFETALECVESTAELAKADAVFLLSDGEITWGADTPAALARDHADLFSRRWICYSFGSVPANRRLFEELARKGGQIVQVGQGQDLAEAARAHRYPVYRFEGLRSTMQDEIVVAGDPALLYPGQVLEVAVRMQRTSADLRLVLRADGKDYEIRVPVARQAMTDALAARSWGELFVSKLMDEPDQATQKAIFALSRHFALANDYASFIILETDEAYQQYGISVAPLDFRQIRQTLSSRPPARSRDRVVLSGLAVPEDLPAESTTLLASLSSLGRFAIWESPPAADVAWAPKYLLGRPAITPESATTTSLYLAGRDLMALAAAESGAAPRKTTSDASAPKQDASLHAAHALRVLSTIAETRPRDDQALRLTGFVLMQWGFYDEAEHLFGRVRVRRPFEPQNMLLEAMAQAAQGKAADAALRYEMVLHQTFPRFQDASRLVAARLEADILREALRRNAGSADRALWQNRLAELGNEEGEQVRGLRPGEVPAGRLLLFWNIDDTDVDLHVREGPFSEVWYERMSSPGGGRLYWDNTEGLGPELYEHPRLSAFGFHVYVDYFASSSVEGAAPAATYVAAFTRIGRESRYRVSWHATVLVGAEEDKVEIMPLWRR
jgi:hypothetical protein